MAYWRRSPGQMQAATESVAVAPASAVPAKAAKSPRPRMMRQYDLVERVRSYNPDTNEDLLNRAYVYAMKAHGAQTRASGDPYFSHPLEVAAILTDLKLDDATIVAALLHDTIEDTEATRAEIDHVFGHEIGALVEGLTKLKRLELVSREAKQAENLRKLLLAIADDVRVLLIKLADRLHNMRTLEFVPPTARRRIAEETLDIYAPLAGRMGMQEMREELEDLSFRTLDPEAYAVVMQRLDALADRNRNLIGEIESQLSKNLQKNGVTAHVYGRRKQPFSIWTKMERKSVGFEQLSDIFGFRVVMKDVEACYRALGVVHTTWPVVPGRFKDYISTPKQNDYRSLHTTVIGPGNQRVELQIRTEEMDQIAELGIAAHAFYKDGVGFADRTAEARIQCLRLAAPHHRNSVGERQSGRISRAYQARAVSRPGVLLYPEGQADRAAAPGQCDRFRLCGAYRCRQQRGGLQDQRQVRAAVVRTAERRRGRGPDLGGASRAAVGVGIARGHRQGEGGDPARHPHRRARSICRPRPPHRGAAVRARQDRIRRRQAQGRAAAAGARLDRRRDGGGRARRDEGLRRRARDVSGLQGRAGRPLWRQEKPRGQAEAEIAAGSGAQPVGDTDPRHQFRICRSSSRRTAVRCRATASSASSRPGRASRSIRSSRRR